MFKTKTFYKVTIIIQQINDINLAIYSTANNVFQHEDTQSYDTYVGSTPHLNFFK